MPLKQLDDPCWVIANTDGSRAGYWDERHFADEDEAADTLDCERDDDAEVAGLAPHQLARPCHVIICDGCGKGYSSEDDGCGTDHFDTRADATRQSGDTEFRGDRTTWCEECR